MFFIQKQQNIKLQKKQEVKRVICLTTKSVLIVTKQSILLHDLFENETLSQLIIRDYAEQTNKQEQFKGQSSQTYDKNREIIVAQYHPFFKCLYFIVQEIFEEEGETKLKYLLGFTQVQQQKFTQIQIIWDFSKHPTKYATKQLKPKLIIAQNSQYLVLVREFHSDSQLVIFKQNKELNSFFLNQQCMSSYDGLTTLVSFRNYFQNKITIQLIDISCLKEKKVTVHKIPVDNSGTLLTVKRISMQKQMILAINWKNNNTEYAIINQQTMDFTQRFSLQNQRIIHFHWFNSPYAVSLNFINNTPKLILNKISLSKIEQKNLIDDDLDYEEWDSFNLQEDSPVIINYSQDIRSCDIQVKITRILDKKQGYVYLFDKFFDRQSDALMEETWNLLTGFKSPNQIYEQINKQ